MALNLAAVADINTVINQLKAQNFDISPEKFYDRQLLDAIKLGNEHYVHLRHAITKDIPAGYQSVQMRRWGGLTAHTEPLAEGIPPKSDKTAMEYITITATNFGRYMEFTDRVSFDQIDPQIAHYTKEMSDVAVRTLERYAREEMLKATTKYFGNQRTSAGQLILGEMITFDTLRIIVLHMKRMLVKPLNGYWHVLCSPEFKHDLIMDPLVKEFMKLEQTGQSYINGEIPPLFGIKLVETMLDEFYTLELDNPGEYNDGAFLRVYKKDGNTEIYVNIPAAGYRKVNSDIYLSDGSAIPKQVRWDVKKFFTDKLAATTKTVDATKVVRGVDGTITETAITYTVVAGDDTAFGQLPIHKAILLGNEAIVKTGISGQGGAKMYVKPLGSAGVLDPIDQRQSIGFKINSVGIQVWRDEALAILYTVPSQAAFAYTEDLLGSQMVRTFDATKSATHAGHTY